MIRIGPNDPPFTAAEATKLGWYIARMGKRSVAGPNVDQSDLQKKVDRIVDGARKRAEKAANK